MIIKKTAKQRRSEKKINRKTRKRLPRMVKQTTAKSTQMRRRRTMKQHGGLPGVQIIAPILRAALNHASNKAEILIPILKDIIPLIKAVIADDTETLANQQIAKELEEPFKKTFENYLSVKNTFTQTAHRDVDDYLRSKMGSQIDTPKANTQLNKLTKTIFQNDEFRQRILYENLSDILSDSDVSADSCAASQGHHPNSPRGSQ